MDEMEGRARQSNGIAGGGAKARQEKNRKGKVSGRRGTQGEARPGKRGLGS